MHSEAVQKKIDLDILCAAVLKRHGDQLVLSPAKNMLLGIYINALIREDEDLYNRRGTIALVMKSIIQCDESTALEALEVLRDGAG